MCVCVSIQSFKFLPTFKPGSKANSNTAVISLHCVLRPSRPASYTWWTHGHHSDVTHHTVCDVTHHTVCDVTFHTVPLVLVILELYRGTVSRKTQSLWFPCSRCDWALWIATNLCKLRLIFVNCDWSLWTATDPCELRLILVNCDWSLWTATDKSKVGLIMTVVDL